MDVSFHTEGLAALCDSERRLAERWGPELGRLVGRRLLELAAATAATLEQIPTARVRTHRSGDTTITFADAVVIRGRVDASGHARGADAERFVIISVDARGRRAR
jgi:hypothetical protein